jgi:hypothetical protein
VSFLAVNDTAAKGDSKDGGVLAVVAKYLIMILVVSVLPAPDSPETRMDWLRDCSSGGLRIRR